VLTIKQTTVVQYNKTQVYFNQFNCLHMYATCFSAYLDCLQACHYKEQRTYMADTIKSKGSFLMVNQ